MDQSPIRSRTSGNNVPGLERIACTVVGGALAALGLHKGSIGGVSLAALGGALVARGVGGRCPLYRARAVRNGLHVRRSITIQGTPHEIYALWRDLPNLPRFMKHVTSIEMEPGDISHWVVQEGPFTLEWYAEIVEDTPGRRLRWRSLSGGDIYTEGEIDLYEAPGGRGTVVDVKMMYKPPGGVVAAGLLSGFLRKLPSVQISEELSRLQQLVETGEIATGACNAGQLDAAEQVQLPMQRGLAPGQPATAGVSP